MSDTRSPAPWQLDPDSEGEGVLDSKGYLVADCCIFTRDGRSRRTNLGNARLIAAAPDLLAALRALVESDGLAFYHDDDIEGTVRVCVHCHEFSQTPAEIDHEDSCIVGKARAAIAAAEGRS